eukprot:1685106-Amphidinium_carterae.1
MASSSGGSPNFKRAKSALARAHEKDGSTNKRPRVRGNPSLANQVEQAIRDHCQGWSEFQLRVLTVDGL